jgi:outer membrane lipoprotein SlyB
MRHRLISGIVIATLLALALAAGCKTQTRSDADVAADVQKKVASDGALQNKPVSVQAANGIVTLSGTVDSEAARSLAANDAATVPGVKTVVNNLQVQPVQAQAQPLEQIPEPTPQAAPSKPAPGRKTHSASTQPSRNNSQGGSSSNYEQDYSSHNVAPVQPAAPVTPPPPSKVTVPAGTTLAVRLIDGLDSERNHQGDTFRATLNSPVTVDDNVVIPADADIQGRVVDARNATHFSGSSALVLEITKISYNGRTYTIQTNQWSRQGKGRGANTAGKVGGGAALGAVIGAIAGGGKGAAIGSVVGAGAGGGVQAATRGEQIRLSPEALLTFQLQAPVTVLAAPENERNAGRHKLDQ